MTDRRSACLLDTHCEERVHLCALRVGELREGVDRLAPGRRRDQLDQWLAVDLTDRFVDRILAVDAAVAQ